MAVDASGESVHTWQFRASNLSPKPPFVHFCALIFASLAEEN